MSVNFHSPNYRASQSDLAVSISPLGLVELADEEFEVHGPRLNRYASAWAWYLGHHWSHRREMGDQQITMNYTRTLADYITNFCFGKGVQFRTPEANASIIPQLLHKVWNEDNNKSKLLWEMGQLATVTGDCFVKVAYEEPWVDPLGVQMPGRTRIIPINPAHCFPEYHPHDRDRLLRFKLKYRFWGTSPEGTRQVYTFTEILTDETVEQYINDELIDQYPNPIGAIPIVHIPNTSISSSPWGQSDIWDIISLNREMNEKMTEVSDIINYHCVDDQTEVLTADGWKRQDEVQDGDFVLTVNPATDDIEWQPATFNRFDFDGHLTQWDNHIDALTTEGHRWLVDRRHGRERSLVREFSTTSEVGSLTQGSRIVLGGGVPAAFSEIPKYDTEVVELVGWLITEGCLVTLPSGSRHFTLHQSDTANPQHVSSIRRLARHFREEGHKFTEQSPRENGVIGWYIGVGLSESLLSLIPNKELPSEFVRNLTVYQAERLLQTVLDADGTGTTWYQNSRANRDAVQMLCSLLGRRTRSFENNRGDGVVTQYSRDHILAEHTVGTPVPYTGTVWCPTVDNGTWMARRNGCTFWTGNSAPVTIITGAKHSNLERGAKKVWAGLPKDAKVFNLESRGEMSGALEFIQFIKQAMHEITGVPESALGQTQPISNTSGVALAIQYQPMMNRYSMKKTHFSKGLEKVNELVIRTQAVHEPWTLQWDPGQAVVPEKDHATALDPSDPNTYKTECHWPEPLPVDNLIKMNEIQFKMQMGLESKLGALKELGEEFPNEKMAEIYEELQNDAYDQGALSLINAQVDAAVMSMTGMVSPEGTQPALTSAGGSEVTSAGSPAGGGMLPGISVEGDVVNQLSQRAYGARLAQNRTPDSD